MSSNKAAIAIDAITHSVESSGVILANAAMVKTYKVCVPGNGQALPQGFMIVKLQWKPKNSMEALSK